MKEKCIKAEDVKNLPPAEEIHGLDNPTQVVRVNSLYRYDKVEIPSTKLHSPCLDEFDDFYFYSLLFLFTFILKLLKFQKFSENVKEIFEGLF